MKTKTQSSSRRRQSPDYSVERSLSPRTVSHKVVRIVQEADESFLREMAKSGTGGNWFPKIVITGTFQNQRQFAHS